MACASIEGSVTVKYAWDFDLGRTYPPADLRVYAAARLVFAASQGDEFTLDRSLLGNPLTVTFDSKSVTVICPDIEARDDLFLDVTEDRAILSDAKAHRAAMFDAIENAVENQPDADVDLLIGRLKSIWDAMLEKMDFGLKELIISDDLLEQWDLKPEEQARYLMRKFSILTQDDTANIRVISKLLLQLAVNLSPSLFEGREAQCRAASIESDVNTAPDLGLVSAIVKALFSAAKVMELQGL